MELHSDKYIIGWATRGYTEFTEWMQPTDTELSSRARCTMGVSSGGLWSMMAALTGNCGFEFCSASWKMFHMMRMCRLWHLWQILSSTKFMLKNRTVGFKFFLTDNVLSDFILSCWASFSAILEITCLAVLYEKHQCRKKGNWKSEE